MSKNSNSVKIAHIVSTFPPALGGMGSVCYEEVKGLVKNGYEVDVYTLDYKINKEIENHGFKVFRSKTWFRFGDAGAILGLCLKLRKYDLVHLHFPFYGSMHMVWLTKLLFKQKYIVTYHMDVELEGVKRFLQKIYDNLFVKKVLSNAEKVITIDRDHFENSTFFKYIDKEKVVENFNGVDEKKFVRWPDVMNQEKEKFKAGKKTVLFVGNLIAFKRLDLLIEAISELDESINLLVVGGGYEEKKYKKQVKDLGIENRVVFEGRCDSSSNMVNYYNLADCLVVPSDSGESFSLTSVEAMSCECPIIVSDIPGVRGRVEDGANGLLFKSGSKEDLIKKINMFFSLSENEKEQMGKAGREIVLNKYTWEKHIKKLEEIYHYE